MRYLRNRFYLLVFIFASIFILNMIFMKYFFNINILDPSATLRKLNDSSVKKGEGKEAAPVELTGEATGNGPGGNQYKEPGAKNSEAGEKEENSGNRHEGLYMTSDELTSLTRLGIKDKITALSILSKLEPEDKDKIYRISSDGITYSEYYEIEAILENRLTPNEIEKLRSILDKNRELYAQGLR